MLRSLSQDTGGRVFFVDDVRQLPAIYSQIADELANQYIDRLQLQERQARRRLAPVDVRVTPARDDGAHQGRILRARHSRR